MGIEQQFTDIQRKHPSELAFTFALLHELMFPSSGDELISASEQDSALESYAIVIEHNDNSMAMAGRLLEVLSNK